MKYFFFISLLATLFLSNTDCSHQNKDVYKGRLEIKGICMNYTISVIDGDIDTSLVERQWTDENTGKSYTNVFALDQQCNFPDTIDAGEEFYFRVDSVKKECTVCMAYYPVPRKRLPIIVVNK